VTESELTTRVGRGMRRLGALMPFAPAEQVQPVVRRLRGMDSVFCSLELPVQPMTIMSLILLAPGVAPDGSSAPLDLDRLRRHVTERLGALPAFRWRVVRVPFGLRHPVCVEDPDFDITCHIEEHVLAAPGTADQLDAYCSEQAGRPLDRRRPLWRVTLVHGLMDGRQAVVITIHHCVADGFAIVNTIGVLLGELGADTTSRSTGSPSTSKSARVPGAGRLLADALAEGARTARRLPALIRASKTNAAAVKNATALSPIVPPTERDTPACPLNRVSSVGRTFARTSLDVEDLEQVRKAAGVTVNDVVLALVAGALRDYLSASGSLPVRPLVAMVPVGLDRPGAPRRTFGNRISGLATTLATDLVDPWDRLITIGAVTARAKRLLVVGNLELPLEWLDQVPPLVFHQAVRYQGRRLRRNPGTAASSSNVVVSQVPSVSPGSSLAGASLEAPYITGPPNNGVGVNIVLNRYSDRMFVSILCADAAVPAPAELVDGLHRALSELLAAARRAAVAARSGNAMAMEQA
jgi:diacylglycerol O-acyltransferase